VKSRIVPQPDKTTTLAEFYERFAPSLYAYACLLARSKTEADDVLQDTFVHLAGQLGRLDRIGNLRGYLFAMLRNEAFRQRSRWQRWWHGDLACGSVLFEQATSPSQAEQADGEAITRALATLPPEQREAVFLKVWQEMTFAEIAGLLGISANTAASRYRYGIAKLKGLLNHER
jgi:RNA polymerase sigma-70 factor (ECF subfamily)